MKYLQSFFESSRYLILQEVITQIKELSLFLKDEGFELSFGIMPTGGSITKYANFDDQGPGSNLGDIQLKMISLGKMVAFYKINLSGLLPSRLFTKAGNNCLDDNHKEMVCDVVLSIADLFEREEIEVVGFWYRSCEVDRHGFNRTNFEFVNLEKLLEAITSGIALDIRIAFTGQKLLSESTSQKLEKSDLLDIEDLVKDYNEDLEEVTISTSYTPIEEQDPIEAHFSAPTYTLNVIVFDDSRDDSHERGFDLLVIRDFLITLMNHLGVTELDLEIMYISDWWRQPVGVTKEELEKGSVHQGKIQSLVITFEHTGV